MPRVEDKVVGIVSPLSTQAMDGVAAGVNAAKKKRRKKNKKKAVAQEADANSEDSSAEEVSETERKPFANQSTKPSASNADELYQTRRLDPMAMTIAECVKRGFKAGDVSEVVNEMWEKMLPNYDDPDTVIAYLTKKHEALHTDLPVKDASHKHVRQELKKTEAETSSAEKGSPDKPSSPSQPSLAKRLELAASHEDVEGSLLALSQWVAVAPIADTKVFFDSEALQLVMQKVLIANAQPGAPSSSIKIKLSTFLGKLLATEKGIVAEGSVKAILGVIDRVKELGSTSPFSENVLGSIACTLVSDIRAFRRRILAQTSELRELPTFDNKIQSLRMDLAKNISVRDLFILRDLQLEATKRHQSATGILSSSGMEHIQEDASTDRTALLNLILQEALNASPETLISKRREVEEGKKKLRALREERDTHVRPVQEAKEKCILELEVLKGRREQLLKELADVDSEIAGFEAQKETFESTVSELCSKFQAEVNKWDQELHGAASFIKQAEGGEHLIDSLKSLDNVLKVESVKVISQGQGGLDGKKRELMRSAIKYFDGYLETEVKCVQYLQDRIKKIQAQTTQLEQECEYYKTLGMEKNIEALKAKLDTLHSNLVEDNNAVPSLINSARELHQKLIAQLESCPEALASDGVVLHSIKRRLNSLGLATDWVLPATIVPPPRPTLIPQMPVNVEAVPVLGTPIAPPQRAGQAPQPPARVARPIKERSEDMGKVLSWAKAATKGVVSGVGQTKGILDIQAEELQGRSKKEANGVPVASIAEGAATEEGDKNRRRRGRGVKGKAEESSNGPNGVHVGAPDAEVAEDQSSKSSDVVVGESVLAKLVQVESSAKPISNGGIEEEEGGPKDINVEEDKEQQAPTPV